MKTWILILFAGGCLAVSSGCSMCCGPYDYFYPTYGGRHERVNPEWGRVGSRFSDPNFGYVGPSADSNLEKVEPKNSTGTNALDNDPSSPNSDVDGNSILPDRIQDNNEQPQPDDQNTAARRWRQRPVNRRPSGWR